ncbi:hypothetical protein IQ06DRAFT_98909 [Phaeosphaeriaceae sp. SRC1lsM3a]|nr:hypothetical protein IQ06DRAFT_98909 [Stagonospora sp. SRC1lsM3a]
MKDVYFSQAAFQSSDSSWSIGPCFSDLTFMYLLKVSNGIQEQAKTTLKLKLFGGRLQDSLEEDLKRRESRATLGMLGIAFIFSSMSSGKESDDYMRLAAGLAYACFMVAYCRPVVLKNSWRQGYCALAAALATSMVRRALLSSPVRAYLASLTLKIFRHSLCLWQYLCVISRPTCPMY